MFAMKQRMMTTRIVVSLNCCILIFCSGSGNLVVGGESAIVLREFDAAGQGTQVRIELKAEGLFRPGLPAGSIGPEARMPKPLALDVKTRLVFIERLLEDKAEAETRQGAATDTRAPYSKRKVIRWVSQAAAAINGEVRPMSSLLRPELSLLVAERAGTDAAVVVVSPAGPLTRPELELVEGLGDPLELADSLPAQEIAKGRSWKLSTAAANALSGYDSVKTCTLEATLERVDESMARVRLQGEVEGSVLGGAGTISCEGFFTFDRRAGLIDRLEVNRAEKRQAGPVEAGLDVKSTLSVIRRRVPLPAELGDAALANVSLGTSPQRQLLQLVAASGKYTLLHDRQWHTYWDDPKLTVLKRIENGQVIAQCNLASGPSAGKGRHQDLNQFRDDIRGSLKEKFIQFLGAGEVGGNPAGGFRYKVGVQGREGDLGVLWYYYLIANPEGDQLLATYTLAAQNAKDFGDQDLEMIGSMEWTSPAKDKAKAP
jgi:hypothetical protein